MRHFKTKEEEFAYIKQVVDELVKQTEHGHLVYRKMIGNLFTAYHRDLFRAIHTRSDIKITFPSLYQVTVVTPTQSYTMSLQTFQDMFNYFLDHIDDVL